MASLYEIKECYRQWQNKIMEQDGEITDEDMKAFNELDALSEDKIEAYAVIIKEKKIEKQGYFEEKKRIEKEEKRCDKEINRLTQALDEFMRLQGKDKFVSAKTRIYYRKSTSLAIEDNAKIPKKYLRIKTEADKTAITKLLNDGGKLAGCKLIENMNLQIK